MFDDVYHFQIQLRLRDYAHLEPAAIVAGLRAEFRVAADTCANAVVAKLKELDVAAELAAPPESDAHEG